MKQLVSDIVKSADQKLISMVLEGSIDELYQHSIGEGSTRFVVPLGNGWVAKLPLNDSGVFQTQVEFDMYNKVFGIRDFSPQIASTEELLEEGILFMQEVETLDNVIYSICDTSYNLVEEVDSLTSGDGSYLLSRLDDLIGEDAFIYEPLLNSLDEVLDWVERHDIDDTHIGNFGIYEGEVVMIDFGWGFR